MDLIKKIRKEATNHPNKHNHTTRPFSPFTDVREVGMVAGVVVGISLAILIVVLIIWLVFRKKEKKKYEEEETPNEIR